MLTSSNLSHSKSVNPSSAPVPLENFPFMPVLWVGIPMGQFHVALKITSDNNLHVVAYVDWKDAQKRSITQIECIYNPEARAVFEVFLEKICPEGGFDFKSGKDLFDRFTEITTGLRPSRSWSIKKHVVEVLRAHGKLCAQLDLSRENQFFPSESFFCPSDWKKYLGLDVEEFALPPNFQKLCSEISAANSEAEIYKTHLCVFIPEGVNLEMVESATSNPKQEHRCGLRNKHTEFVQAFLAQYGQIPSEESEWVLIPKEVLARRKNTLVPECKSEGYRPLSAKVGLMALLLIHVKTGRRYYPSAPASYVKCEERVIRGTLKQSVAIGGFNDKGIDVTYAYETGFERQGVGAARTFIALPDAASLFRAIS